MAKLLKLGTKSVPKSSKTVEVDKKREWQNSNIYWIFISCYHASARESLATTSFIWSPLKLKIVKAISHYMFMLTLIVFADGYEQGIPHKISPKRSYPPQGTKRTIILQRKKFCNPSISFLNAVDIFLPSFC